MKKSIFFSSLLLIMFSLFVISADLTSFTDDFSTFDNSVWSNFTANYLNFTHTGSQIHFNGSVVVANGSPSNEARIFTVNELPADSFNVSADVNLTNFTNHSADGWQVEVGISVVNGTSYIRSADGFYCSLSQARGTVYSLSPNVTALVYLNDTDGTPNFEVFSSFVNAGTLRIEYNNATSSFNCSLSNSSGMIASVSTTGAIIPSNARLSLSGALGNLGLSSNVSGNLSVFVDNFNLSGVDDTIAPTVSIETTNVTNTSDSTPTVAFNVTDNAASTASCTLYSGSTAYGTNSSVTVSASTDITFNSSLSDGNITYYVNCSDGSNTAVSGTNLLILDATVPSLTINSPTNQSNVNSVQILNFTFSDSNDIGEPVVNITNSSGDLITALSGIDEEGGDFTEVEDGSDLVYNFTWDVTNGSYPDGNYTLLFLVNDSFGNLNTSSFLITVDTVTPGILNVSNSSITSSGVTITWNGTESVNGTIAYGTSTGFGSTATDTSFEQNKSISLSSLSASTQYFYNITTCDQAGNCNMTGPYNFTTSAAASSSSSSSSSSGGGGSLGASGGVSSTSSTFSKSVWTSINAGEKATVDLSDTETSLTEIEFSLGKTTYGVVLQVSSLSKLPSDVNAYSRQTYKMLDIDEKNLQKELSGDVTIQFKVEKEWLLENEISKDNVALLRYVDGEWMALPTAASSDDGDFVYYSATTPGFSYFLIGQKGEESKTTSPLVQEPASGEDVGESPGEVLGESVDEVAKESSFLWLWVVLLLVILGIVLYVFLTSYAKKR